MIKKIVRKTVIVTTLPPDFSLDCPVPLNAKKLTAIVIRAIATALELPESRMREETLMMIEGKLTEQNHEPQNVQVTTVRSAEVEDPTILFLQLINREGAFLQVDVQKAREASTSDLEQSSASEELYSEQLSEGEVIVRLDKAEEENKILREELSELSSQIVKVTQRMKDLWRVNCSLAREFEEVMGSKDEEIARLRQQVSGPTNGNSGTCDPEVSLGTNTPNS